MSRRNGGSSSQAAAYTDSNRSFLPTSSDTEQLSEVQPGLEEQQHQNHQQAYPRVVEPDTILAMPGVGMDGSVRPADLKHVPSQRWKPWKRS